MHDLIYSDQGAVGGVGVCVLFGLDWIGLDGGWVTGMGCLIGGGNRVLSRGEMISIIGDSFSNPEGRGKKGCWQGERARLAQKDGPREAGVGFAPIVDIHALPQSPVP